MSYPVWKKIRAEHLDDPTNWERTYTRYLHNPAAETNSRSTSSPRPRRKRTITTRSTTGCPTAPAPIRNPATRVRSDTRCVSREEALPITPVVAETARLRQDAPLSQRGNSERSEAT